MTPACRLALAVTALLGGCAFAPRLAPPPIEVPSRFAEAPTVDRPAAEPATEIPWWQGFDDPLLQTLVQEGLRDNADVRIALDRLAAAHAYERGAVSVLLPSVGATAGGGNGTGVDETKGRVDTALGAGLNTKAVPLVQSAGGFDAVWQLDLFGRSRLALTDARVGREWLEAARDGVRQAVAADIGEAYIRYREAQWQRELLDGAVRTAREAAVLAEDRYRAGIRNGLDAQVADREAETVDAARSIAQASLTNARSGLAVLLGRYPETVDTRLDGTLPVPATAGAVPDVLPIDLLTRRPDLRQSVADWQRAGIRVADAKAALLPRVSLTAVVGAERGPESAGAVAGAHLWSVGPAMTWPVLDFGALDAAINTATWQQRAALDAYRKAVLTAVADVDRHRSLLRADRDRRSHLQAAVLASDAAVKLARARYAAGLTDFAAVADSDREAVRAQLAYTEATADAAVEWIRLNVALGGGWTAPAAAEDGERAPDPAVVALLRRLQER